MSDISPPTLKAAPGGLEPHRGTLILVLGILSIVVSLMCCVTIPLPVGMALGIPAWIMGKNDSAKITSGQMDPLGAGMTKGGMICGIVGTILSLLGAILTGAALIFGIGMGMGVFDTIR
jgi:hypothetical protein